MPGWPIAGSAATLSTMTFRPALRPGAPLLRRDSSSLQVGTSPGVVIADQPGLLALLRLIDGSRDVARLQAIARTSIPEFDGDVALVLRELHALGVVFDSTRWSGPHRRGLDAEARQADLSGRDPAMLAVRPTFRMAFHTDAVCRPIVDATRIVLAESGVRSLDSDDPELVLIATCGEPSRTVFERLALEGLDYLPLVIDEDRVRIGPLVRPGRTPCISCHDLHRADWDRAWPALLPQFGRHTGILTPPALSAVTVHAAALELAVEVLAHCDGRAPRSAGHLLVVGPGHDQPASWPLAFHHSCACDLLNADVNGAA